MLRKKILPALFIICGIVTVMIIVARYRDSFIERYSPTVFGSHRSQGVVFYDRWRTDNEYLVLNEHFHTNQCRVFDREGQLVYDFPNGFCHVFQDGSIFFMASEQTLRFYDPRAKEIWKVSAQAHHDLDVSPDEQRIYILSDTEEEVDGKKITTHFVKGYSRTNGEEIFSWNPAEHLNEFENLMPGDGPGGGVKFHLNSVQELPPNIHENENPAFKRGNILVNCFHNDKVFIIDRLTGQVVWQHNFDVQVSADDQSVKKQDVGGAHAVKLLPNGNIFFLQNQYKYQYRNTSFSAIVEMNPITKKIVWRYLANPATNFKTEMWGSVFKLANGNALITYSSAGSAFEVTPEGRLVWEWVNPDKDDFGVPAPIYRVDHVSRALVDKVIRQWKEVQ